MLAFRFDNGLPNSNYIYNPIQLHLKSILKFSIFELKSLSISYYESNTLRVVVVQLVVQNWVRTHSGLKFDQLFLISVFLLLRFVQNFRNENYY